MRPFLLGFMILLVIVTSGIVGYSLVADRSQFMLIAVVPALLFFPTLLIYLFVATRTAGKQRHQGMADLAKRMALVYSPDVSQQVRSQLERFALIDAESGLFDQIQGERNGIPFTLLACRVGGNGGQQMHHRYYTLCWFPNQFPDAPSFALTQNRLLPRQTRFSNCREINLGGTSSATAFSKRYRLQAIRETVPAVVEALFDEEMLQSLLGDDDISLQVSYASMLAWNSPALQQDLRRGHRSMRENVAHNAERTLDRAFAARSLLAQKLSR